LVFDLYDRVTATFASRDVLEDKLRNTRLSLVPVLEVRGGEDTSASRPSDEELKAMIQWPSKFYDGRVEGVYIKVERDGRVIARGKVVRGDFIAGNEHWTRGELTLNGIVTVSEETLSW
jgi:atypical dual specificity phosphatase